MPHQPRWNHLIQRLTGNPPPPDAFKRLVSAYTEPHRHYHTLSHIDHCLAELDRVKTLCTSPDEVEFAIWLHDVVYDTHAADNEEKSAEMVAEILYQCNCAENRVEKVRELILATKHLKSPTDMDAQLLVDIDLAILGQPLEDFHIYEQNIREEYSWVSAEEFKIGRAKVLQHFLDRPTIYSTTRFRELYERQARKNIAAALDDLGSGKWNNKS